MSQSVFCGILAHRTVRWQIRCDAEPRAQLNLGNSFFKKK